MTGRNITASFQVTGICPYNSKIDVPGIAKKEFTSFDPENLPKRTGLSYIPFYSPARRNRLQMPLRDTETGDGFNISYSKPGTVEEEEKQRELDKEEAKKTPTKKSQIPIRSRLFIRQMCLELNFLTLPHFINFIESAVSRQHEIQFTTQEEDSFSPFTDKEIHIAQRQHTGISKYLIASQPPSKQPTKHKKSSATVLTSADNLKRIEQREKEKEERDKCKKERAQLNTKRKQKKEKETHENENGMFTFTIILYFIKAFLW